MSSSGAHRHQYPACFVLAIEGWCRGRKLVQILKSSQILSPVPTPTGLPTKPEHLSSPHPASTPATYAGWPWLRLLQGLCAWDGSRIQRLAVEFILTVQGKMCFFGD